MIIHHEINIIGLKKLIKTYIIARFLSYFILYCSLAIAMFYLQIKKTIILKKKITSIKKYREE